MKETAFAMLPKPGTDLSVANNWRYVALMSYMANLYDLLLRERIRPVIDPLLRFNQNGFRQKRNMHSDSNGSRQSLHSWILKTLFLQYNGTPS